MSDPILSREEVDKLADCCFVHSNQLTPHQWRSYAERIEAAVLERVCGEPAAWMVLAANTGLPCEVTLHKSETEALRQYCVIPLYAINRSKS
ncbi:hypothetical protein KTE52_31370 [Burkholderia multivorans]|uniref:Uncharacterized protein n=1 Tax=Burkholderia multivorans TaxID=87883 RepID=A0AAP2MSG8_9BURK|nr:hypothetical protein [Burkholderia multivorans]MBU9360824.1 hypothetical protein [Burkholderia multivorans]